MVSCYSSHSEILCCWFEQDSDMFLDLNPIEDNNSSITYNNVLHGLDMEDDSFEDDFNNDHH